MSDDIEGESEKLIDEADEIIKEVHESSETEMSDEQILDQSMRIVDVKVKLKKLYLKAKTQLRDWDKLRSKFERMEEEGRFVTEFSSDDLKFEIVSQGGDYLIPATITQNESSKMWYSGFLVAYKVTNIGDIEHLRWKLIDAEPNDVIIDKSKSVIIKRFFPIYKSHDKTSCMLVGNEKLKDWNKLKNTDKRFIFYVWLTFRDPEFQGEFMEVIVPDPNQESSYRGD